jgi:phage terminase large subunit
MNYRVSPVFWANVNANTRYIVNEGGARSGKTYSILQTLINKHALKKKGQIIDIVRKTQRELRDTVMVDFFEILNAMGLYNARQHNRTNLEYYLNDNLFRFIGLDKAQKKRGSKRHILYCNEANGLTLEDWIQLSIRCEDTIYIDYNPSEEFWVDDHVLARRDKCTFIHSTYLDNYDFLPKEQIEEIERLIDVDDFYYKVYALGIRAIMKGKIYTKLNKIKDLDYDLIDEDLKFYGLDFGYEHATVLTEIKWAAEQTFERAVYFERHKTDDQLIQWMLDNNISGQICADHAYPASIAKLRDAGFEVRKAKKDIRDGVRFCQALKRNICEGSSEYYSQNNKYKYRQTADGKVIEEPVKKDDDGPDSFRYGAYTILREFYNPMGV